PGDRAPALDHPTRRSDPGDGEGAHRGARHARRAARPRRPLRQALRRAVSRSRGGGVKAEASPARQLDRFLAKFDPETRSLIRAARAALRRRWPGANELVWDNYNFFVIGYCTTERPSSAIVTIAAAAGGVGISFYRGASLPDPQKVLLGSGKQNRFVRLES